MSDKIGISIGDAIVLNNVNNINEGILLENSIGICVSKKKLDNCGREIRNMLINSEKKIKILRRDVSEDISNVVEIIKDNAIKGYAVRELR